MALLLALPINLGLVATEALFRCRIVRAYDPVFGRNCDPKIGREGAEICVQIEPVKDGSGISDGSQGLEMVFVD
ncbi:hypothetical protein NC652_011112 [Populus alba x Populus x berolinensis]|nr:hypothetical protein NC652_011112 [Populus alba x Populus x berolinensis]